MTPTRLLVSVRDAREAQLAASAGADIIDVKEPDHGSLGFAGADRINQVLDAVPQRIPVSAALGECLEHAERDSNTFRIPNTLSFVKLGLSQTLRRETSIATVGTKDLNTDDGNADWRSAWKRTREFVESRSGWAETNNSPRWVAVAYADAGDEAAPPATDVLDAAIEAGCAGLLIDTFGKERGSTFDLMSLTELVQLRNAANCGGMFFALAGQIGSSDIDKVQQIQPDILAVRGAVCSGNDRRSSIDAQKVHSLKQLLNTPCTML